MNWLNTPCIAFEGSKRIAQGMLKEVAVASKAVMDRSVAATHPLPLLIFDERSSETIELDWRGSELEFLQRLGQRAAQMDALAASSCATIITAAPTITASTTTTATTGTAKAGKTEHLTPNEVGSLADGELAATRRGPGRPRLGVVPREVTLLPRHWDWLATQPGGASVALRKLVEVARLSSEVKDRARKAREVGYKFMSTMAGHEVGFEEASRALFAGNQSAFDLQIAAWPEDVQHYLKKLLIDAFEESL